MQNPIGKFIGRAETPPSDPGLRIQKSSRFRPLGRLLDLIAAERKKLLGEETASPEKLINQCHTLLGMPGEASSAALASEILEHFSLLNDEDRQSFFLGLVQEFQPDPNRLKLAIDAYLSDSDASNVSELGQAAEPIRQELFRQLNISAGGTAAIVNLREKLLQTLANHPEFKPLDDDLLHLLRSWFNRGFLSLERITWETSASILEKLIAYESVHQIKDWDDLHRRLADDRRCFAFFHPQLPDEPLIFVEVALVKGISSSIDNILQPEDNADKTLEPDTAVFYSINNCHRGLKGISFGNFLIKQVTEMLTEELSSLRCFTTLSPIPGFRSWLEQEHEEIIQELGNLDDPESFSMAHESDKTQQKILSLCAYYLLHAKRGSQPLDPVARFHLRNGARVERINWMGDHSEKGYRESFGILVNYLYDPEKVAENHEHYASSHQVICSSQVKNMARPSLA